MKNKSNDLNKWCDLKIILWNKQSRIIFKQGDIWWCSSSLNSRQSTVF
ncbi:hypothetical protein KJ853_00420 [Patescibacteria group bacterium]|nr:hypothetical protein [Patescibacteria group bacterium]